MVIINFLFLLFWLPVYTFSGDFRWRFWNTRSSLGLTIFPRASCRWGGGAGTCPEGYPEMENAINLINFENPFCRTKLGRTNFLNFLMRTPYTFLVTIARRGSPRLDLSNPIKATREHLVYLQPFMIMYNRLVRSYTSNLSPKLWGGSYL